MPSNNGSPRRTRSTKFSRNSSFTVRSRQPDDTSAPKVPGFEVMRGMLLLGYGAGRGPNVRPAKREDRTMKRTAFVATLVLSIVTLAMPTARAGDPRTVRITLKRIGSGLSHPVGVVFSPDGSGRMFIVEQTG